MEVFFGRRAAFSAAVAGRTWSHSAGRKAPSGCLGEGGRRATAGKLAEGRNAAVDAVVVAVVAGVVSVEAVVGAAHAEGVVGVLGAGPRSSCGGCWRGGRAGWEVAGAG